MTILCIFMMVVAVCVLNAIGRMQTGDVATMFFVALLVLNFVVPILYLSGVRS